MAPHDLPGLLTPYDTGNFLRTCWGQQLPARSRNSGKFSELLPWPALNLILEQHRLDTPRLRLTREGKSIPGERLSFLSSESPKTQSADCASTRRRSDSELRDGATLVLDAVDELQAPITELAESLERVFRVRIQVNAYADGALPTASTCTGMITMYSSCK